MLWLAIPLPRFRSEGRPFSAPEALACWAGRYTPRVSLADDALLLEIAPSLRLFGGLAALLAQIRADLAAQDLAAHCALAPTPLAARWLARGDDGGRCLDSAQLRVALSPLPLAVLDLPHDIALRLAGFGLRHLGDLLALPRPALGTRVGAGVVIALARALGEIDDPQPWFAFPEQFELTLELPAPVAAAPVLLFAAHRLLAPLVGWLAARNAALSELRLFIGHGRGHGPATVLPLRFSAPVQAAARIERVLKEALERLVLNAPALELRLVADRTEPRDARSQGLFGSGGTDGDGGALAELFDRLVARLGVEALRVPRRIADHRPERTGSDHAPALRAKVSPGGTAATADFSSVRPLWLLEHPRPLAERHGRPHCNGALTLLAGPERIESGWWDGADARRDYFIASDPASAWLWIYRDSRPNGGWFLHGLFS